MHGPAAVHGRISVKRYLGLRKVAGWKIIDVGKNVRKSASQRLGTGRSLFLAHRAVLGEWSKSHFHREDSSIERKWPNPLC